MTWEQSKDVTGNVPFLEQQTLLRYTILPDLAELLEQTKPGWTWVLAVGEA